MAQAIFIRTADRFEAAIRTFDMYISVVICTHNRANSLSRTLRSMCCLQIPTDKQWELLVVANACVDDTPNVVESFESKLPVRLVEEPSPGLSKARNCGAAEARGVWIVYTDDDVEVTRDWLQAFADGFNLYPDTAFFGGQILPVYDKPRPDWLTDELEKSPFGGICGCRRIEGDAMPYKKGLHLPFGGNFAVRRSLLVERGFREDLGVSRTSRLSHEETELFIRLQERGFAGISLPAAIVHHHTCSDKLRPRSIVRAAFCYGRSDVIAGIKSLPDTFNWSYWRWNVYMMRLLRDTFRLFWLRLSSSAGIFYRQLYLIARKWGRVYEWQRKKARNNKTFNSVQEP